MSLFQLPCKKIKYKKKTDKEKRRFHAKILSFGVIPHQITTHFKGNEKDKNTGPPTTFQPYILCQKREKKKAGKMREKDENAIFLNGVLGWVNATDFFAFRPCQHFFFDISAKKKRLFI